MKKVLILLVASFLLLLANVNEGKNKSKSNSPQENKTELIQVLTHDDITLQKRDGKVSAQIIFNDKDDSNSKKEELSKKVFKLSGTYTNIRLINGSSKININWDKVTLNKSEKTLNEPFKTTLKTKEDIPKESKFSARGDLDALNIIMNKAVEEDKENASQASLNSQNNKETEKSNDGSNGNDSTKPSSDSGLLAMSKNSTPASSGASSSIPNSLDSSNSGLSNLDLSSSDQTQESCENLINGNNVQFREMIGGVCTNVGTEVPIRVTVEGCTPRVDNEKNLVYISSKKVADKEGRETTIVDCAIDFDNPVPLETTYTGCDTVFRKDKVGLVQQMQRYFIFDKEQINIGVCIDSDIVHKVDTFKEYNQQCQPLVDYANKEITFMSREVVNVNGQLEEITPCKFDEASQTLYETYVGCDVKNDFTNKQSIQQKRYYYMFQNSQQNLGECLDSDIIFNHYQTSDTCSFQVLNGTHVVYNKRTAYKDINNIVKYITPCQPSTDGSIALIEQDEGYEHDFVNNQSYPLSSYYFFDPDTNEKIMVQGATKKALNFPHKRESCGYNMNDVGLFGTEKVKIYFTDTQKGEDIFLLQDDLESGTMDENGCVPENPVPYAKTLERVEFIKSLGFKQLEKIGENYYIVGSGEEINHGNGLYPTLKGGSTDITKYVTDTIGDPCFPSKTNTYGNGIKTSCIGGTQSTQSTQYTKWYAYSWGADAGDSCEQKFATYTKYTCNHFDYWEEVGEYNLIVEYLRPDGTTYNQSSSKVYRIIK
ncbi:MAG: hypothetical protein AB7D96_02375 [Arcobacteraceae bacterium]